MTDLLAPLVGLGPGLHPLQWTIAGRQVDARLRLQRRARHLVIHFHGAINRETRTPPIFNGLMPDLPMAHQLTFADPSMLLPGPHRIAWFAGDEQFATQAELVRLIAALVERLKVRRTIYFGASGGGFAALLFSHCHPGSFAVVGNPQTRILAHPGPAVDAYLAWCRPSLADRQQLGTVTVADLPALYGQGFANTVVFIQALGDVMHYRRHMLPFAQAALAAPDAARFVLHTPLAARLGHVTTPADYQDWVRAICTAPGREPHHILATLHTLHAARSQGVIPPPRAAGFTADMLAMAERLARWYAARHDQSAAR